MKRFSLPASRAFCDEEEEYEPRWVLPPRLVFTRRRLLCIAPKGLWDFPPSPKEGAVDLYAHWLCLGSDRRIEIFYKHLIFLARYGGQQIEHTQYWSLQQIRRSVRDLAEYLSEENKKGAMSSTSSSGF